jgi:hypothetical protein
LKTSELSPIHPTTVNPFNPPINPAIPNSATKGISVEDVASYFKIAFNKQTDEKKILELTSDSAKLEVFKELIKNVHPLALGNVYRIYLQIRLLAKQLLIRHLKKTDETIEKVIKALTEDFYSHQHSIFYDEAVGLFGRKIIKLATESEKKAMANLFDAYSGALKMNRRFSLREWIGDELSKELVQDGAVIQSAGIPQYTYKVKMNISQRSELPPNLNIQSPPGAAIPLIPNYPRAFNVDLVSMNWEET